MDVMQTAQQQTQDQQQIQTTWEDRVQQANAFESGVMMLQDEQEEKEQDEFAELLQVQEFEMIGHVPITFLSYDKKSRAQYKKDYKEARKLAKDKHVSVTGHTIRLLSAGDDKVEEQDIDRLITGSESEEIKQLKTDRSKRDRVKSLMLLNTKKADTEEARTAALSETVQNIDSMEYDLVNEFVIKPFWNADSEKFGELFSERAILTDPVTAKKNIDTIKAVRAIVKRMRNNEDPVRELVFKKKKMDLYWGHNGDEGLNYAIEIFERNAGLCEEAYRAVLWGHGVMLDEETDKFTLRDETTAYDRRMSESITKRPLERVLAEFGFIDQNSIEFKAADEHLTSAVIKEGRETIERITRGEDEKAALDAYIRGMAGNEQYTAQKANIDTIVADYKMIIDNEKITRRKMLLSRTRLLPWERNDDISLVYSRMIKGYETKKAALDNAIKHLVEGKNLDSKYVPYLMGYRFIDSVGNKMETDDHFATHKNNLIVINSSLEATFNKEKEKNQYVTMFGGTYASEIGSMLHDMPELSELQKDENEATLKYFELAGRILKHKAANHSGFPREVNREELKTVGNKVFVRETRKVKEFMQNFAYKTATDEELMGNVSTITKLYYSMRLMHRMHDKLKAVSEPGASLLDSKEKETLALSFEKVMEGLYRKTRGVTIKQVTERFGYDESLLTEGEKSQANKYPQNVRAQLVLEHAENLIVEGDEKISGNDADVFVHPGYTNEEQGSLEKRLVRAQRDINGAKVERGSSVDKYYTDVASVIANTGVYTEEEKNEAAKRFELASDVYLLEHGSYHVVGDLLGPCTKDVVALRRNIGEGLWDEDFERMVKELAAYRKEANEQNKRVTLGATRDMLEALAPHYLELGKRYRIIKGGYKKDVYDSTVNEVLKAPYDYMSFLRHDLDLAFDPNAVYDSEDAEEHYDLFCDMCRASKSEIAFNTRIDVVIYVAYALKGYVEAQMKGRMMVDQGLGDSYEEEAKDAFRSELASDEHMKKLQIRNAYSNLGVYI